MKRCVLHRTIKNHLERYLCAVMLKKRSLFLSNLNIFESEKFRSLFSPFGHNDTWNMCSGGRVSIRCLARLCMRRNKVVVWCVRLCNLNNCVKRDRIKWYHIHMWERYALRLRLLLLFMQAILNGRSLSDSVISIHFIPTLFFGGMATYKLRLCDGSFHDIKLP